MPTPLQDCHLKVVTCNGVNVKVCDVTSCAGWCRIPQPALPSEADLYAISNMGQSQQDLPPSWHSDQELQILQAQHTWSRLRGNARATCFACMCCMQLAAEDHDFDHSKHLLQSSPCIMSHTKHAVIFKLHLNSAQHVQLC